MALEVVTLDTGGVIPGRGSLIPVKRRVVFTGLIEEVGRLIQLTPTQGGGGRLKVQADVVLEDIKLGDSIAVNGTCLTAVEWNIQDRWVLFDAVAETLNKTTLAHLTSGSPLNLERALAVGARVGGHYVTGHVDGSGWLFATEKQGNGIIYSFKAEPALMPLIAPKGSIAVDGISLTVVDVGAESFSVWIVPHTASATNLSQLEPGDKVNLETDILAKYVARMVCSSAQGGTVSMNKLKEAGFLS